MGERVEREASLVSARQQFLLIAVSFWVLYTGKVHSCRKYICGYKKRKEGISMPSPRKESSLKESIMKKVMNIEGMRCPHCSSNVEKALCAVEGVKSAVVDLAAKTATVEAEDSVVDAALEAAVDDLGFEVKSIA